MSSSAPPPPPSEPTGSGYEPPTGSGYQAPTGSGHQQPTGAGYQAPTGPPAEGAYPPAHSTTPAGSAGSTTPGQQSGAARPNPLTGMHQYDLGLLAAGALLFLLSFFPFYTVDVGGLGSGSGNAWDSFWSWFAVLLGLAATAMILLPRLGVSLPVPARLIALGCWALALVCLIIALMTFPYDGPVPDAAKDAFDEATGHGFGLYASLLVSAVATALAFLRKDATDTSTA